MDAAAHVPVLAGPAISWLRVRPDGTYVDATAGAGGHSVLIAEQLRGGRLLALDRDPRAVELAQGRLAKFDGVTVMHWNYGELAVLLTELGIATVDGVLIDAGFSSMQLDDASRGFSFQESGPLDMRMDPTCGPRAVEWLGTVSEDTLADVLKSYGDVRPARRIARAIVRRRDAGGLCETGDLAAAVREALPFVRGVPEETRTVFQAIRIALNEEYRWLEAGLQQSIDVLAPEGRLVVIAFHSGEDRIVKRVIREASRPRRELTADGRVRAVIPPTLHELTEKPVTPDAEEAKQNPRCKSARLRAAERLGTEQVKAG